MLKEVVITVTGREQRQAPRPPLVDEFPSVKLTPGDASKLADWCIHVNDFREPTFDLWAFDRKLDELAGAPFVLGIEGDANEVWEMAAAVLTRAQRCMGRRNRHSEATFFDRVLSTHRALYDTKKPLVIADFDHALDVWQWMLRLDPNASAAAQIAALFHDIERLRSEADSRIEANAADYQAFKDAHARAGAEIVRACLREADIDADIERRAVDLVAHHERFDDEDEERKLLGDADGLSFFSFNSPGFIDYFGEAHTRRKIVYTLGRLSPRARRRLDSLRLRQDIASLLRDCSEEVSRNPSSSSSSGSTNVEHRVGWGPRKPRSSGAGRRVPPRRTSERLGELSTSLEEAKG